MTNNNPSHIKQKKDNQNNIYWIENQLSLLSLSLSKLLSTFYLWSHVSTGPMQQQAGRHKAHEF